MTGQPRAYLDTNVFIAAFETTGGPHEDAWSLLRAIENGLLTGVTSELTLAELLVKPFEQGSADLAQAYETMLMSSDRLMVRPVERSFLVDAARLRSARSGLKLPDAIHLATAIRTGCGVMISGDRGICAASGMKRLPLGPDCLEHVVGGGATR